MSATPPPWQPIEGATPAETLESVQRHAAQHGWHDALRQEAAVALWELGRFAQCRAILQDRPLRGLSPQAPEPALAWRVPEGPSSHYRRPQGLVSLKGRQYVFSKLKKLSRRGDPASRARAIAHAGEVMLWLGRVAEARRFFRRSVAVSEEPPWPPIGLAACELLEGRPARALQLLEDAVRRGSDPRVTLVWRGEALRRLGRAKEARFLLDELLGTHPHHVSALLNRGLCGVKDQGGWLKTAERTAPRLFDVVRPGGPGRRLSEALALMRGNRSSWMPTFLAAGRLRSACPLRDSQGRFLFC